MMRFTKKETNINFHLFFGLLAEKVWNRTNTKVLGPGIFKDNGDLFYIHYHFQLYFRPNFQFKCKIAGT